MYKALILLVAFSTAMFFNRCDGRLICPPCLTEEECEREPEEICLYGITKDYCNRKVCAKGPLQQCGGAFDRLGKCGNGMNCRCNRCMGCYLGDLLQCPPTSDYFLNC